VGVLRLVALPLVLFVRVLLRPWHLIRRRRAAGSAGRLRLVLDAPLRSHASAPEPRLRRLLQRSRRGRALPVTRLVRALRLAAVDPGVKSVELSLAGVSGSLRLVRVLHRELLALRAAGKRLLVHARQPLDNAPYALATAGERLLVRPAVPLAPIGVASDQVFVGPVLERLGIEVVVFAAGRYKSAPEALTRSTRSAEDREQATALVRGLDAALVDTIAAGRGRASDAVRAMMDAGPTHGALAVERGLADGLAHDEELAIQLAALDGADADAHAVELDDYAARRRLPRLLPERGRAIGVVEVSGAIIDRGQPYSGLLSRSAVEAQVVADLRAALASPRIAAVVLSIDSPGGSVLASEAIWSAVRRVDREKPVIALMNDVAASGGYYAAIGARAIVASPETITGSIGVFATSFVAPALAARVGLTTDLVHERRHAGLFSPFRPVDDAVRALGEAEVQAMYRTFVELVSAARRRSYAEIDAVAQGRVWLGADAHAAGLVDGLGGLEEAIDRARTAAGGRLRADPVVLGARKPLPVPSPPPAPSSAPSDAPPLDAPTRAVLATLPPALRDLVALVVLPRRAAAWAYTTWGIDLA
jgi:protease-4